MIVLLFIILQIEIVALSQVNTRRIKLTHATTMNKLAYLKKNLLQHQNALNQKEQLADNCNQQITTAMDIISKEILALFHVLLGEISNQSN